MKNKQAKERLDLQQDGSLDVHSVWFTLQGEGPKAGTPAVFVRLAGCNLQCPGCDTDYTSKRKRMDANEVFESIEETFPESLRNTQQYPLVVITGGEPLRQNLTSLLRILIYHDYNVQVETNGTMPPADLDYWNGLMYVVSPKTPSIHPDIEGEAFAFKYIVEAGYLEADGLPSRALGGLRPARPNPQRFYAGPENIFLQPMDEKDEARNKANRDAALESCMKFGYRMSIQMHKLLGLP